MKPHPRIRKTIKWGGAAVTVLLVVVWIGSGWCSPGWVSKGRAVALDRGRVCLIRLEGLAVPDGAMWSVQPADMPHWYLWFDSFKQYEIGPRIPLWCPVLLALLATTAAWRLDALARRRARLNVCPKCGYDRAGIAGDANCPECGCGGASGRPASNEPRTK
jgi:hypothetical protein